MGLRMPKQIIRFDEMDLSVMDDVLDLVRDRLCHFPDGEMGWDEDTVQTFWEIDRRFHEAGKAAGFWWAR